MSKFLTFDLGTTLYKVALFDEQGSLLAVERAQPPINQPKPGWVEICPHEFLKVLAEALGKLRNRTVSDWRDIAAVSFSTQANSFSLVESDSMLPFVLWTDQRATSVADELASIASLPGFREKTGMSRFSPALALAKVLWLRRNTPRQLEKLRHFWFISDFLTAYLSSRAVTEAGVAGLSGALNIRTLEWWKDVLDRVNIPPIEMLPVVRAGTDLGTIRPDWRDYLDLPPSCRFVVGCLDQYAGAIGTGTIVPGHLCETTGTVLAAVRCSNRLETDLPDDVYQGPAFDEGKFFQMSFSSTSANLLEWYRNSLAHRPSFEELSRLAGQADDAVTIEPYRDEEPIERCFRHVRPEHSVGQVVRGIMRCVAEALKRQVSSLSSKTPESIRCAGGAAKSDVWLQIKADALGTTMEAVDCPEPTSLGAAMLAARALGFGSLPELAARWVKVRRAFTPAK